MPPKVKQFNDGHISQGTAEVGFLREAFIRETKCRDNFNLGKAYKDIELKGTITLAPPKDDRMHTLVADIAQVDALKRRKELIKAELDHIQGVLRHKQVCLRAGGTVKTLHPAMQQTSAMDLPEVKLDHTRF